MSVTNHIVFRGRLEFGVLSMCAVLGHEGRTPQFAPELPAGRQRGDGALTLSFLH